MTNRPAGRTAAVTWTRRTAAVTWTRRTAADTWTGGRSIKNAPDTWTR
jgi:hypothetical protein